ncbi:hypothetical protein J4866_02770 [Prevotella denticola]|uniref:Uncharacterized protein n=3 Tax=Prevotellaceae TaxID=171552 RepID=H1HJN9_9BACT|nr:MULTISPECIES: hypothetical protein [Prevotellaceae]EHO73809.1 hypothetical protein HMPREF9944_00383 [Segatella maculosa OT 289]QUB93287.1 hypothetical protein J4866_02770 [Prevotella denticola]SJZ73492.1 hypothetical protein SAMN02745202_00945 [Segatella oulorum]
MRTETRTYDIYNLHELTREAQAKAHSHWAEHFDYSWADENEKTLQAFEQIFNIKVDRWSYDDYSYWYRFTSHYSEEEDNLKGVRLLKYLVNNYWNDLYIPKTIWGHNYKTKRKSRIFVTNDCVLTGYYMDYEILQPIYDFLKAPDNTTLYELMNKCLNGFFKACRDDMEYQLSEEAFAESCEANNYEFLSNGTLFN